MEEGNTRLISIILAMFVLCIGLVSFFFFATIANGAVTSGQASSTPAATNVRTLLAATSTSASSASTSIGIIETQPPDPLIAQISSIVATSSASSAVIDWQTSNQFSTGSIEYGTTTDYGATSTGDLALDHSVTLSDLTPGTTYHFVISATTGAGTVTSPDQVFTTLPPPPQSNGRSPVISMIQVVPTYSMATISWTTDQAASAEVFYGETPLYATSTSGSAELAAIPTTDHVVTIDGLSPDTTYHFAVVSTDAAGLTSTSSDATFTTAQE